MISECERVWIQIRPDKIGFKLFAYQASRQECVIENYFSHFSIKTYVVGTQKIVSMIRFF